METYNNTRKLALASAITLAMVAIAGSLAATGQSGDIAEAHQESRILTTYALNRHLDAQEINVTVDDGVVTLTGKVSEDISKELAQQINISKELAQQIALGVSGIKEVDNQIEVDAD